MRYDRIHVNVAIECLVADLEREDLAAQAFLGEPGRQRTAFAAARIRNMLFKPDEKRSGSARKREEDERTFHRSGEVRRLAQRGARHLALLSSVVCRSTFSLSAAASRGDLPGFVGIEEAMTPVPPPSQGDSTSLCKLRARGNSCEHVDTD
ncbi:hypothetical protein ISCGN_018016 [Ixodes scapularis]